MVEVRDLFGIGAPHVVAPQVQIAKLLPYGAAATESAGRGGDGRVKKSEAPVFIERRCQFKILKERPVWEAAHGFEGRPLDKLPPVSKAEPNPRKAGAPSVKTEEGSWIVKPEAEGTAGRAEVVEGGADQRQAIWGQKCVGMQKQEYLSCRMLSPTVHLSRSTLLSPQDGCADGARTLPGLVRRPAIHNEDLVGPFLRMNSP